jgi:coilin
MMSLTLFLIFTWLTEYLFTLLHCRSCQPEQNGNGSVDASHILSGSKKVLIYHFTEHMANICVFNSEMCCSLSSRNWVKLSMM